MRIKTFETEISFWTDVINKGGYKARGLNNRGLAWARKGNYSAAIKDFKQAILLLPEYSIAYANAGDIFLKMKKYKKAITYYNNYLKLCNSCPDAHIRIANGIRAIKKENAQSSLDEKR